MFDIDEVILRLHTHIFLFHLKPLMTRLISPPWKLFPDDIPFIFKARDFVILFFKSRAVYVY